MKRDVAVLQAVEKRHGLLTADFLVKDAAAKNHPWHNRFTWDDAIAGHRWRIDQARELIRSVRYQVVEEEQIYRSAAYIRDPDADSASQGYVPVVRLRTEGQRARDAVLAEFERVGASLRRARDVSGTLGLAKEIDQMIVSVDGLAARVTRGAAPRRARVAAE